MSWTIWPSGWTASTPENSISWSNRLMFCGVYDVKSRALYLTEDALHSLTDGPLVYRTNLSGENYRVLADNLSATQNYVLDASPAALRLAANEYITEFMVSFGIVPPNFRQWKPP